MATEQSSVTDVARQPPSAHDVYEFLAGAGAVGVSLAGLVQQARGQGSGFPNLFPMWLWVAGSALLLLAAARPSARGNRLTPALLGLCFLAGAAASYLPGSRLALLLRDTSLGAWGGLMVVRRGFGMPSSMARSGLALGAAAASSGFLPGLWKWLSIGAMILVVLVAAWVLDDLEAEGLVHPDRQEGG